MPSPDTRTSEGLAVYDIRDLDAPRRMPVTTADLLEGTRFGTPGSRWGFACPLPL